MLTSSDQIHQRAAALFSYRHIINYVDKEKIREFFDRCAPSWDEELVVDEQVINAILDNAGVEKDKDVLDVACGTGVMIPYYLKRNVRSITAIDFSEKMYKIASSKFHQDNVRIICKDVEEFDEGIRYDCIIVYNAFPHFVDSEKLISHLSSLLKKDGILTIAHGMSRAKLNHHHHNISEEVRHDLIEADELAKIISDYLEITTIISNDRMYQVSGKKR